VTTRADMASRLELSPSSPTKTFVLEAHTAEPKELLLEMAGSGNVEDTEDAYLLRARIGPGIIWVDQLNPRFWSFHTDLPVKDASTFLSPLVETRRDLDWIWLPSDHLRYSWPGSVSRRVRTSFNGSQFIGSDTPAQDLRVQLAGRDASSLLDLITQDDRYRAAVSFESIQASIIDADFGGIEEAVNKMGRFAVSGNSFELHLQFVQRVVNRYSNLINLCESAALKFGPFDSVSEGGGSLQGGPIVIRFSKPIDDLARFVTTLFSSRQPFRLWGVPDLEGDYAEIEAVDLHVGQPLPIDVGPDWMRVYLHAGSCGNTVARLITNLQHTFDGALYLEDPVLDRALHPNGPWPQQAKVASSG
jgi:hypothetical protein